MDAIGHHLPIHQHGLVCGIAARYDAQTGRERDTDAVCRGLAGHGSVVDVDVDCDGDYSQCIPDRRAVRGLERPLMRTEWYLTVFDMVRVAVGVGAFVMFSPSLFFCNGKDFW